jgi:hypothetical protein
VRFERNKLTGRKWVHVDPVAGHVLHPDYARPDYCSRPGCTVVATLPLFMLFQRIMPLPCLSSPPPSASYYTLQLVPVKMLAESI